MKALPTRRDFLAQGSAATLALALGNLPSAAAEPAALPFSSSASPGNPPLRLGLMTYNLGRDWDMDTLIGNCQEAKFEHAELRTTHRHGVEVSLSAAQRREVRKRLEDAGIALSLASAFA